MGPPPDNLLRMFALQARELALMLLDPGGRITWWSPGAERTFGWSATEIVGQPVSVLFIPEDVELGLERHEMAVAAADVVAEDDRWQLRRDGSRFWASGVMIALRDEAGALVAYGKSLRNRTEVKEQIETLRNLAASHEQAGRRKDVFLSTLSHELRNPLAPLANAVQIVRMAGPTTADVDYALKVIDRQVELLRRLVDDLLDVSRIGAGKLDLRLEALNLSDVVLRAVETSRTLIERRRHHLDVLLPPGAIPVRADMARMVQVLVNLLNNAAKYTPEGGHITVKSTVEGMEAVARVQDSGVGIAGDMLPRIFELFTQAEGSNRLAPGGLGIGLAVVKDIVALHGGSVQVQSQGPGKGSEFAVRLPLAGGRGESPGA